MSAERAALLWLYLFFVFGDGTRDEIAAVARLL